MNLFVSFLVQRVKKLNRLHCKALPLETNAQPLEYKDLSKLFRYRLFPNS